VCACLLVYVRAGEEAKNRENNHNRRKQEIGNEEGEEEEEEEGERDKYTLPLYLLSPQ